jgi:ABC-type transporter Mla subunit MlaD
MQGKNDNSAKVGLFALFALFALVYGWSWLKSFSLFNNPQRFAAEFSDVAGLSRNATVNVQGVRVGTVEFMEFVQPTKKIRVHLKITDPTATVPQGSKVSIQTLGLVGAKYIEINIPRDASGNAIQAAPIANGTVLRPPDVQDPVRVELVMNRVASRVDELVSSIDTAAASEAINNLNQASVKLNNNMDRLKDAATSVQSASNSIANTSARFGTTADNASAAATSANQFFSSGNATMRDIQVLARDFRGTSTRVNKLLDNPNFSGDLRETMLQARQTAETVRGAMGDLNTTLKDKQLRDEVIAILQRLQNSTENIRTSMEIVNKISADQALRSDLKDVVRGAKEAMQEASTLLGDPAFKENLGATMQRVRSAATNVDIASKQIQNVLGKRAPLLQMLFGKPGKITPDMIPPNTPGPLPAAPLPGPKP